MNWQRLDFKSLLEVTSSMQSRFWGNLLPSTSVSGDNRSIIKKRNLDANPDTFYRIFSKLYSLVLPNAFETYRADLMAPLAQIWDGFIETQHLSLLMKNPWFANLTHRCIELGAETPFLILYSQYFAKSLDNKAEFISTIHSYGRGHSLRCM